MVRNHAMGSPLPFGAALKPDMVVAEAGDYSKDDGLRVVLSGENLVFQGAFEGTQVTMGIAINDILDAISKHTRVNES